jgi:hypothetical protein
MNNNKEQNRANRLVEQLDSGKTVNGSDMPFIRMAKALEQDAKDTKELDQSVINEQKMHLLQMAKNIKESNMQKSSQARNAESAISETPKVKKSLLNKPWYLWMGAFTVTAAVVLAVFASRDGSFPLSPFRQDSASFMGKATMSVIIPAAHAGDAFSILVEKGSNESAAIDTFFRIVSKVDVSESDLKQSLRIVPVSREADGVYIDFDLRKTENGEYIVTPDKMLDPGEVYKLTIAAAVEEDDSVKQREFSWAVQTQDKFRVLRSVPGNKSSFVPVDTAIEITLSKTGWQDPSSYFEIVPKVEGKFENHGRTLVFLPNQPLKEGTIYTIKYKAGWGVSNEMLLEEDHVIVFETAETTEYSRNQSYFGVWKYVFESSLKQDVLIPVSASDDLRETEVEITGYAISMDETLAAITELDSIPHWAIASKNNSDALKKRAVHEAFSMRVVLESPQNSWQKFIRLPASISKGFYVVKMVPKAGEATWIVLQKTDVAAYAMTDQEQLLVWVINRDTSKPLVNLPISIQGEAGKTDTGGVAMLKASAIWADYFNNKNKKDFNLESTVTNIKIGDSENGLILSLNYLDYSAYGAMYDRSGASDKYWSYLYPDRPLYNLQDEAYFYGILQERDTGKAGGKMHVELRSYEMDYYNFQNIVFAKADVVTDESGFFNGKIKWTSAIAPNTYYLVLVKDGVDLTNKIIEIRNVEKPAYAITIKTDKSNIYAGDTVTGQINSAFYDGTPYAKLGLNFDVYGAAGADRQVTTDASGNARFDFKTQIPDCRINDDYVNCPETTSLRLTAFPLAGEESEIFADENVTMWRGRHYLNTGMETIRNNQATIKITVKEVDLQKMEYDGSEPYGNGVAEAEVINEVFELHWDKQQSGTWYDPIEKKVHPSYTYKRRLVSVGKFTSRTDSAGEAILNFPIKNDVNYRIVTTYKENSGSLHAGLNYVYTGSNYFSEHGWTGENQLSLESMRSEKNNNSYNIGEEVALQFVKDREKMDQDNSMFLFVKTSRGIKSHLSSNNPRYNFTFGDSDVPNVTIYGIAYTERGFEQTMYWAYYDTADKKLNVSLTTDKQQYAPGSVVKVRASVADANGQAVKNATVAVSVVDEALLAVATMSSDPDTLQSLYKHVIDGILVTNWSHQHEETGPGGGAEMGGGGGMGNIRKNFKDTAAFMVLNTDSSGNAEQTFSVPDNITSWRLTAAAITPNLYAGQSISNIAVTKEIFVDAVIPNNLLNQDKPVIKLRAHGRALPSQGEVRYIVDIPTLGIDKQEVTGEILEPVYLAIDNLQDGKHDAYIQVKINGKTDAIKRVIEVMQSRATHEEKVIVELGPGTGLPDPDVSSSVQVTFESKAKAQKRAEVWNLAHPWSARLESLLAGAMMQKLHEDVYGEKIDYEISSLLAYQKTDGGIAILPYASADTALSAKAASARLNVFDNKKLANYFWEISDNAKASREESIDALAGLAALGQPVLERLKTVEAISDLSWREKISLIRGLEAAGQRENALATLNALLEKADTHDGVMRLNISDDVNEEIEAAAQVAAMAAVLAHKDAEKLMSYVDSFWGHPVMTDLDKALYLQKIVPTLPSANVKIAYTTNEEVSEIDLSKWPYHTISLTADEVRRFRVISVNGPAAASFFKRTVGDVKESSPLLNVSRLYQPVGKSIDNLSEGDRVSVNLDVSWDPRAQDGCYILRDRLPGAFKPLVNVKYDYWSRSDDWYPHDVLSGEVSFVVCKSDKPVNIKYMTRVVSLGKYHTEGAILQSMMTPGLSAVSKPTVIEVK